MIQNITRTKNVVQEETVKQILICDLCLKEQVIMENTGIISTFSASDFINLHISSNKFNYGAYWNNIPSDKNIDTIQHLCQECYLTKVYPPLHDIFGDTLLRGK